MPRENSLKDEASEANKSIVIHMAHGDNDDMVTPRASKKAFDDLTKLQYNVSYNQYPMGHELCLKEIRDIGLWMNALLG